VEHRLPDGIPIAFIDWDRAQAAQPLADLADAAWTFASGATRAAARAAAWLQGVSIKIARVL
jgi:aminoglycoside phosphotransferase (APT) family kinase protein